MTATMQPRQSRRRSAVLVAMLTFCLASTVNGQKTSRHHHVGAYTLYLPTGWSAEQLRDGVLELRSAGPAPVTAQLAPQRIDFGVASPAPAINFLAGAMHQWNPRERMLPFGDPASIDQHVSHLGGSAATQAYGQQYQDARGALAPVHGLFTLHLTSAGQAIAIDVFLPGEAEGVSTREWQYLVDQTKLLLTHLRTRAP